MVITILLGFFAILFSFYSGRSINDKYLFFAFISIFIYLALRYDFGNDYMVYFDKFLEVNQTSWSELRDVNGIEALGESMEFGFIFILKVFSTFSGFYFFIAIHSLIMCIVYYYFIKNNVEIQYYWLAVFIFIFNPNLLLVELSAIRQTLAILCFLYSIRFLANRNIIKYLICILIASSFHLSAIILFPLYFLFSTRSVKKYEPIVYVVLYLVFLVFGNLLLSPLESITSTYLPKYITYVDDAEKATLETGFGMIISSVIYLFILIFAKRETDTEKIIYRIVALFIVLTPLSLALNMLSRINFYFEPFLIIIIPQILTTNLNRLIKIFFIALVILMSVVSTYGHFNNLIYKDNYYEYKSIINQ